MLTTNRTPRRRLLAGSAAVAIVSLAGLGVTASGTAAAAHVRASVEEATGVELASLVPVAPVMPVTPTSPVAAARPVTPMGVAVGAVQSPPAPSETTLPPPPAPVAGSAMPAPPAPPAPVTGEHSRTVEITRKDGRVVRRRIVVDGKELGEQIAENMPDVSEADCPGSSGATMINVREGKRQRIIVCTNHIAAMTRDAERLAANAQRQAYDAQQIGRTARRNALDGLTAARTALSTNRDMSESARAEALTSIDEAIQELRADTEKDD